MLVALDITKQRHIAWDVDKTNAPFSCPECGKECLVKKGEVKVHHFAHLAATTCTNAGEGEHHMAAKQFFYNNLKKYVSVELEKVLDEVRADVYFEYKGKKVAIELQDSAISIDEIKRRTLAYNKQGVVVWWICLDWKLARINMVTKVKKWQRYLYKTYDVLHVSAGAFDQVYTVGLKDVSIENSNSRWVSVGYILKTKKRPYIKAAWTFPELYGMVSWHNEGVVLVSYI